MPVAALAGWDALITLRADTVLADMAPLLSRVEGTLALRDGEARLDIAKAELAGGAASGVGTTRHSSRPPGLSVTLGLAAPPSRATCSTSRST